MEHEKKTDIPSVYNITRIVLMLSLTLFLCSLLYLSYHLSNTNQGSIAIPAGQNYLGPPEVLPSWTAFSVPQKQEAPIINGPFTADTQTPWKTWSGRTFPYHFSYPQTLTLADFPGDASDSVGISWGGRKPQENILISIMDLSKTTENQQYVKKSKKDFVSNWWKQFSGLTGVSKIEEFTNSKGLSGYKTRFINTQGQTPNLDVFFEVPKKPELVIRIANGLIDPTTFDKIVDSVEWTGTNPTNPTNTTNPTNEKK